MIICYELSDLMALILHQVKIHDVSAFAASNVVRCTNAIKLQI